MCGISIQGCNQIQVAFWDDVNIITDRLHDLVQVDNAVWKFERMSCAILSRSKKCKALGIGSWKKKNEWPLNFVQRVKEVTIFGIIIKAAEIKSLEIQLEERSRTEREKKDLNKKMENLMRKTSIPLIVNSPQ